MKIQVSRTLITVDGEHTHTASIESDLVPLSEVSQLLEMLDTFVQGEISMTRVEDKPTLQATK